MQPAPELVRLHLSMSAPPASNDHAGSRHTGEARKADPFPGHPHRSIAYVG
jgi:hypothetical protein